jgi:pimeloyl-ACP methyl ester carboxylesterase
MLGTSSRTPRLGRHPQLRPDAAARLAPVADKAIRRDLAKLARGIDPGVPLDAATRFGQFTGPVRILWGERDPFLPHHAGAAAQRGVPARHFHHGPVRPYLPPLDYPDRVAAEITAAVREARQARPAG